MKRIAFCFALTSLLSAGSAYAGVELIARAAYGSAGSGSPVGFQSAPLVLVAPGVPVGPSFAGTIWNGSAKPYGGGLVLDGAVGMKMSIVSFGLTGGIRNASASSPTDDQTDINRSAWRIGLYARLYSPVPLGSFDPWFSAGLGYVHDEQSYTRGLASVTLTHHGLGIPLGIGLDYNVLPIFALGPSFQYEIVKALTSCMKASYGISQTFCSSDDPNQRIVTADGYGVWSIGLDARLSF